ncbi:MAG: type I-C CRISPR-associated endonuclease Cas1c [Gemmatimonadota bacterium]|nr:type I-C CRISPR-associated endonuclease Cas1c [Gemmatimonadota bacterium]
MAIIQNTLYLTTRGTVVHRDHLTLRVEIEKQTRLTVPIHHLESICAFGRVVVTPPAMALCWRHQVAVHYHTESGHLLAQVLGSGDTRYLLRRAQYAAADSPLEASCIARQFVAGKLQNSRANLLRSGREADADSDRKELAGAANGLARLIRKLGNAAPPEPDCGLREALDPIRGMEGLGARVNYAAFQYMLKQQREDFRFLNRSRRPPRDRVNCLLSFIYALVRHDCLAALTTAGLDPYVGWLHATRAGRPACALDLMEEFRPCLAERLALTLINRRQIEPRHFLEREGGAVEFTDHGRREVIQAWQRRKQAEVKHALFKENVRLGQVFSIQARLLARKLRGDIPDYIPYMPK